MARQNKLIALEAATASITTATVTIKTLRVDSRQLTQAVFRQLPERDLINQETVELLGTVWGWVNYMGNGRDTQFVAQFGEELCRCPTWIRYFLPNSKPAWNDYMEEWAESYRSAARNYIISCAIEGRLQFEPYDLTWTFAIKRRSFWGEEKVLAGSHGEELDIEFKSAARSAIHPRREVSKSRMKKEGGWEQYTEAVPDEDVAKEIEDGKKKLVEILKSRTWEWQRSSEWWSARLDQIDAEMAEYATRWNALMNRLKSVEQLFIAT